MRFNDQYTGATLETKLRATMDAQKIPYHMDVRVGGESFYTPPGKHSDLLLNAIKKVTGRTAELSTSGGTSDARFIAPLGAHCIEVGPVNASIHKVDEHVRVADLEALPDLYQRLIERLLG